MKKLYTSEQITNSLEKLNKELPDTDVCNGTLFQTFSNTIIRQDFTKKSLKRINVKHVTFNNANFYCVAATGSKFTKSNFLNCNLSSANFQYCYFYKVHFYEDTLMKGSNFSHSTFIDCYFTKINIEQSTLFDCHFENCLFESSIIKSNTLESTAMHNCQIKNIDLAHINLEYMLFDNMRLENVTLPPYQIAYIIGAPSYIKNTSDEIYFYTDNGLIDNKKYIAFFNDLLVYYYSHKEYFPLANLYIASNRHNLAYECILSGIKDAEDFFDFRMIKHFCKLACANRNFSNTQLKSIYDFITDLSCDQQWDINSLHSYLINIGEIREILLNNYEHKQCAEFTIKTNIDKENLSAVNEFYKQLNVILREYCSSMHIDAIEIRHNSPYEFYVTCIDMLPNLLLLISGMYSILAGAKKFVDFAKSVEEVRQLHQENELYQLKKQEKRLEIERNKLEIEKLKKERITQTSSGIFIVREIEHNLKCNTLNIAKTIAPEYLHYKFKHYTDQ